MASQWAVEEMSDVELRDKRLNKRLVEVLSQLAGRPTASIPVACRGYAETAAAYRLFSNEKVDFDEILAPHIETSRIRVSEKPVVILAQDTTEIDLTRPQQQVVDAGPLDGGSRRGVFLHLLHGFTPDGTPLGTLAADLWARPEPPADGRSSDHRHRPIEEKESQRWIDMIRQAREQAKQSADTRLICVADSEADIYELLVEGGSDPGELGWIVRGCQNRALQPGDPETTENKESNCQVAEHLREQIMSGDELFSYKIAVRGRQAKLSCEDRKRRTSRDARSARVSVRAGGVQLRPPKRPDRKLPEVSVNVVLVHEPNPPLDETPIEWLLLTNLPIDTADQVREVIADYCVRWMIEIFFRTLKSGCQVEHRRLEHLDRIRPCLAIYLIITWRTLHVCRLGREFPEISCEAIFEPEEWKPVYRIVRGEPPPSQPPCLGEMMKMVAELGGYANRKKGANPGPQTIWLGLQRVQDFALCWLMFGPEAQPQAVLV